MSRKAIRAAVALILLAGHGVHAFFSPDVDAPRSFEEGDEVTLKVNKMTSYETLMPVDYYQLPFCQPEGGPTMDHQNLGELLVGDRIKSSPYRLQMKTEMYCEQLCITNLGQSEEEGFTPNKVIKAIGHGYHNNWIVDNLPAASKLEDETSITTRYWQGFPIGFIDVDTKKAYIHNHVNIEIMYHPVEMEVNEYRVVRFTVEPFSINHEFEPVDEDNDVTDGDATSKTNAVANIANPIASCDSKAKEKIHTDYDMITGKGREPQLASGRVLFTYDVIWIENRDLAWATRWDIYLTMDNAIPARVHWLSIASSLVAVILLAAMIVAIVVRNLRRDFARYNRGLTDEEKAEDLEDFGWKLLHADVFRPPSFSPLLFSVACGAGAQILCTVFLTLILSAIGCLSTANRGSLLISMLFLFAIMGCVAGYVTARFYKAFKGDNCQMATVLSALSYSGIACFWFVIMNALAVTEQSTYAIPFTTIVFLLVLWFGISVPMVFVGAHFGYNQDAVDFPVKTSSIQRQIPKQHWFRGSCFTIAIGGILPFGCCFLELYFVLDCIWMGHYYYAFGFLLLVFFILLILCTEISVLFCYSQLCGGNYHWWWRSFWTSGSVALSVFAYSFDFFDAQLQASSIVARVIYIGYMALASLGLFLMTGFVGVASSLWFNIAIYSSVNIE